MLSCSTRSYKAGQSKVQRLGVSGSMQSHTEHKAVSNGSAYCGLALSASGGLVGGEKESRRLPMSTNWRTAVQSPPGRSAVRL